MNRLTQLKVMLYKALLNHTQGKSEDEMSEADINIMYELSRDPEIQKLLEENG